MSDQGIRPGYKQTEVGVIPEDWEAPNLGALKTLMTNGFVGTATRHYERNERGVLYIQGYNVEENSFNFHGIKYVTEEFHKLHMKSCLKAGDLLTVQTGDVGLTTFVPEALSGANCHALIITRFDARKVHSRFVSYYLNGDEGRTRLRLIETGTTMKHLNVGDMLHFVVPLPPLPEQRAIAGALSDADGLIAALEGVIAKKRDLKQAAMQQLLTGKTRLPGFSGEWEVKRLGDCANFFKGKGLPKSALSSAGKFLCIHYGELFTFYGVTIAEVASRTDQREGAFLSVRNDVLMPTSDVTPRGLAKASCLLAGDVILGGDTLVIRPNEMQLDGSFLAAQIRFRDEQVLQLVTGSTVFHLYASDMRKFTLPVPSPAEQTAIAEVLSDMDADLAALEARVAKARAVKQGMMQQLLTGKVRLV